MTVADEGIVGIPSLMPSSGRSRLLLGLAAVVLTASRSKETARELVAYLKRPAIGELLQRSGFAVPHPAPR